MLRVNSSSQLVDKDPDGKRLPVPLLLEALTDAARPVFLFGSTPPREMKSKKQGGGKISEEECRNIAKKFSDRAWALACDGMVVYDIQEEAGRTTEPRPFPFGRTVDPSAYGKMLNAVSGKQCVVYKCVVEESLSSFDEWVEKSHTDHDHSTFTLVGAATSKGAPRGPSLKDAADRINATPGCAFGCVTIAERHLKKGNEHHNLVRKMGMGAEWFISQAVYDVAATVKLVNDYDALCREKLISPKKIVLTFAPCGRKKTMSFIKWLGVCVPPEVEQRIFSEGPDNSLDIATQMICEMLTNILESTARTNVPLGVNVESVSGFREEIDASFTLFQSLQRIMLDHRERKWAVRWVEVTCPVKVRVDTTASEINLSQLAKYGAAAGTGALITVVLFKAFRLS
eukprot:CAMPEP_0185773440 /NCGR_PEP_ID=MMETSP1174-20130828/73589_1 /TAXON_ID=35687 /ORGANISM="Dictyocha speculum, Strain CCMP1381" /LENGTH=398 /DNA_ID=CAMNT_0028460131 /DNA_START=17 /DNA_END=1213 /DNA_ORIENTATION=+